MLLITINDKEYTIEEAKELYNELKALFGDDEQVIPPYVPSEAPPWQQPYPTMPITYFTTNTVNELPQDILWVEPGTLEGLAEEGYNK